MAGLCTRYNTTIAVYGALHESFFHLGNNQVMSGILGSHMNNLLGPPRKRTCTLVTVLSLNRKYKNDTYEKESLLGLFEKKKADFYYRTETYFHDVDNHLYEFSPALTAQHFQIAQFLDSAESSTTDLTLFFTQNFDFILQLVAAFILVYIFLALAVAQQCSETKSKFFERKSLKMVTNNLIGFEFNLTSLSKPGLILLFYNLYVFLFINCLTSNLKTEQIVVDTSGIIDTKYKLLKSKKVICWFEYEIDYILASKSPKETFLYKVFISKQLKKPFRDDDGTIITECKFRTDAFSSTAFNILFKRKLSNYFILMNRTTGLIASALMSRVFEDYSLYMGDYSFYEMTYVSMIRRTLEKEKKDFFKEKVLLESEAGLYYFLIKNFDHDLLESIRKFTKIFTTVEQYVDEHVTTEEIKLSYFKPVIVGLIIWGGVLTFLLYSSHFVYALKKKFFP